LIARDTPEDNAKAVLHFEQAIALDPNYGQAYAGLASAYFNALYSGYCDAAIGMIAQQPLCELVGPVVADFVAKGR
jgi:hypothetical protein